MFLATMQRQSGTYQTKTKRIATAEQVDTFVTSAKLRADKVVYDDTHCGMDYGLVRAVRMSSSTADYVLTIHKIT
jgi:hypothetical protein